MLKISVCALMSALAAFGASAYDYQSMAFETAGGVTRTITVDDLKLSFANSTLTAFTPNQNIELPLADVLSLYFISEKSDMESLPVLNDGVVTVYTMTGVEAGKFDSLSEARNTLPAGMYIVKSNTQTLKVRL